MEIIGLTEEEEKFRQELEEFLERECTEELIAEYEYGVHGPLASALLRKLGAKRWLAPTWPKEYGGLGLPPIYRYIVRQVTSYMGILGDLPGTNVAIDMVGPIMLQSGSDEIKSEFLPRMARGEITFGIGYTEPQAGSDLSAIETTAVEDGDDYVITGHKIFNSCLEYCDYQWCCVRTDLTVPRRKGMSIFIVDVKNTPGFNHKPLVTVSGARTNEVFWDGARIPKKYLFGEKNKGWYYMMGALNVERSQPSGGLERMFDDFLTLVKETSIGGRPISQDPVVRQKVAQVAIEVNIMRKLVRRQVGSGETLAIDAAASHLFGAEGVNIADVATQIMGHYGSLQPDSKWVKARGRFELRCRARATGALGGGSSEVMKNILAIRGLGLPRE